MLDWKLRIALAALGLGFVAQAQAADFSVPTSVVGLSEAGATVADGGPVSSFGDNPADMVFFPGTRMGLDIIADKPSYTFTATGGSSASPSSKLNILPNLFVTHRFDSLPLAVGLGITEPYRINTTWPVGSFPGAADAPIKTDLQLIDVNPGVAYLLLPDLSIGVGVDYYQSISATFDSTLSAASGTGGGVGGNIGLFYTTETWNAGLSYRSQANISAAGGTITLPGRAQAGVRYRFTPALATELDVDWTDWSSAKLPNTPSLGWKSALAYRLGLSYHLNQDLELRGGLAHESNPATSGSYEASVPAAASNLLALGAGVQLGDWHWDLGASYALSGSTTVNNGNGLDGSYKASAFSFGAALSRHF